MRNLSAPALVALMLVCTVPSQTATSLAIGSVTANGSFLVDSSKIWRTGTLFDGDIVETTAASSDVRLNNGMRIRLDQQSRARVYHGRIVLESGSSELQADAAKALEARSLMILSSVPGSVARVRLNGSGKVLVAVVKGSLRVTNASGILVANLAAPGALTFDPQAGAPTITQVSGCLLTKDGKYLIADQTTNVTFEVHGRGLDKQVGNRVAITGTADEAAASLARASQSITVTEVKLVGKGGCASIAKALGAAAGAGAAGGAAAAGAGGAAAGVGISTAVTVAIVGGVATAATLGGLAATGAIGGDDRPATSR
jgi:hypothetical protein